MNADAPLAIRHGPLTVYLQPLDGCPDLDQLAGRLPAGRPQMWLDSARQHPVTGRWSILGWDPWLTLTGRGDRLELRTSAATHRFRGHPLEALREVLRRYRAVAPIGPQSRAVGLMGFLSYELNRWIERLPAPQPSGSRLPDLQWHAMRSAVVVDHLEGRAWALGVMDPHQPRALARREAQAAVAQIQAWCRDAGPRAETPMEPAVCGALRPTTSQAQFERMVLRVLEHVRAGDIYQANVSQQFTAAWRGGSLPLYRTLRRLNPSPFACWFSDGELAIVSCSPERLARVQEGLIDTRPIAGTRPRGLTRDEDALKELELLLSEKERAEHVMLVDLARNDLGRVCRAGSVRVNELMGLEQYSHVMHIVSDVGGRLRPGTDAVDVIRAVFPGGTITGCPKVRCMEILREVESVPRGLYTGSVGTLGFDGTLDLNIAIRTMVLDGPRLSFHVGAGIVADSAPEREYHETLAKAGALMAALEACSEGRVEADAAAR